MNHTPFQDRAQQSRSFPRHRRRFVSILLSRFSNLSCHTHRSFGCVRNCLCPRCLSRLQEWTREPLNSIQLASIAKHCKDIVMMGSNKVPLHGTKVPICANAVNADCVMLAKIVMPPCVTQFVTQTGPLPLERRYWPKTSSAAILLRSPDSVSISQQAWQLKFPKHFLDRTGDTPVNPKSERFQGALVQGNEMLKPN